MSGKTNNTIEPASFVTGAEVCTMFLSVPGMFTIRIPREF